MFHMFLNVQLLEKLQISDYDFLKLHIQYHWVNYILSNFLQSHLSMPSNDHTETEVCIYFNL